MLVDVNISSVVCGEDYFMALGGNTKVLIDFI
jgi:hypothetical protein